MRLYLDRALKEVTKLKATVGKPSLTELVYVCKEETWEHQGHLLRGNHKRTRWEGSCILRRVVSEDSPANTVFLPHHYEKINVFI